LDAKTSSALYLPTQQLPKKMAQAKHRLSLKKRHYLTAAAEEVAAKQQQVDPAETKTMLLVCGS